MRKKQSNTVIFQRVGLSILCILLTLVLVVMIFATVYVQYLMSLMGRTDDTPEDTMSSQDMATLPEETDPDYTGEVEDPTNITLDIIEDVDLVDPDSDGIINILLVGQDRRENESRQRSDVMILCTFNTEKQEMSMTSFLRDSYVYIPGVGNQRLNVAYMKGGFSLLNETLAVNYGIHIDGNVEVDFDGFIGIIDLVGGVDITLSQNEADYMNKNTGFEYNKGEQWNLTAGVNHLTADQALAYARIRKTATINGTNDDFGRTERQRTVLMALINAYKNQSLATMIGLMDDVLPLITTNMTNEEILSYVVNLFPMLATADLSTQYIPAKGSYRDLYVDGIGWVLVPDLKENRDILADILGLE